MFCGLKVTVILRKPPGAGPAGFTVGGPVRDDDGPSRDMVTFELNL